MILVDTSIWIDHLRQGDAELGRLLSSAQVLGHPAVIGELALGSLGNRREILTLLAGLPRAVPSTDAETLGFIDRHALFGHGIGWVDAQLLAAARLTPDARLWSRDKRLAAVAERLGVGYDV